MGDDTARPNPSADGSGAIPDSSVPNPTIPPTSDPIISDPSPIDPSASGGMVDQTVNPAMPNAMAVSMEVPQAVPQPIGTDPNVAPNPFAPTQSPIESGQAEFASPPVPNSVPGAPPIGTTPVLPEPPVTGPPIPNTVRPEVGMSGGGHGQNGPWILIGVIAMVVVLGILGAFAYFSFVAVAPVEVATASPAPIIEASPSSAPVPREMTLEEKIAAEEVGLNELQTSLSAADKGLSDKAGDLSE